MDKNIMNLDRKQLYQFCDELPGPIIARPVLTAYRGRGMTLALEAQGALMLLVERGQPVTFDSLEAVLWELDGAPNVDTSRIIIEAGQFWTH
jgi:hypothetical protein